MPMTKMRAPANFGGLSLAGTPIQVGKDGSYDAHHTEIDALRVHGFTDWNEPKKAGEIENVDLLSKDDLIEAIVSRGRYELQAMPIEELRNVAKRTPEPDAEPTEADAARAAETAKSGGEAAIAKMNRNELFAYLAANKVSCPPPVSNDVLRSRALETFKAAH